MDIIDTHFKRNKNVPAIIVLFVKSISFKILFIEKKITDQILTNYCAKICIDYLYHSKLVQIEPYRSALGNNKVIGQL